MDFFNSVIAFFQTGGTFMYPILLVAALGIAIAVERYIRLIYERHTNRAMWDKLQPVLNSGDFDRARNLVKQDNSGVSKVLAMGLARQGAVRRREDIEIAMEESMMEIIPQLEKRTPYIALLSNIATLLGLLGTIMGLIEAFTAVANANPAEKADLLSASISVAMNTTAFGLMTGIPLLLVHAWLNSLTGEIVDSLEMVSVKALNLISMSTRRRRDVNAEDSVSESRVAESAAEGNSNTATTTEEAEEPTPEVAEESADEEQQLEKV